MNTKLFTCAFVLGAMVVVWVAGGFIGSHVLALVMTMIIGAVYVFGALELHRFRQVTSSLSDALIAIPGKLENLDAWLVGVHPSLQNPVRLRIEGERIGLPSPALTPYLVGLLVMLGMLGTFLGMVVTLNGAAFSLEGTTDLQAIRSALAAPIKGLGLAFGTSVAGVAASAMLGLMSAISRRERILVAQQLDTQIATNLRSFSLVYQRQETYKALQLQSRAIPEVVDKLHTMMVQMERMNLQLNERLIINQDNFHTEVKSIYNNLATSVDKSLRDSLTLSAQVASDSLKPVVENAMKSISLEARVMHERVIDSAQSQIEGLSAHLGATTSAVTQAWKYALANQERTNVTLISGLGQSLDAFTAKFEQRSQSVLTSVENSYVNLLSQKSAEDQQRQDAWMSSLEAMASELHREWQQGGAQTLSQQQTICSTLAKTATEITQQAHANAGNTLDEIARLIETASEAPRAAAEVIGQLRQEMTGRIARDNELLEESSRVMATLNSLLDAINHSATQQRSVIDSLVASSAVALDQIGSQFAEQVNSETAKLSDVAAQVTSSAIEVSSLGETFGFAVRTFNASNEKLITNLQKIEGAMDKSMSRSDEQLAYYVAQAREVIDLSIMSQREVFEELRRLQSQHAYAAQEVS